jgi:tRNA(Ile2) C34 agmatinyltransferase TiaS
MTSFDRYGRVLCTECGGSMRAIDVAAGEALFKCDDCHNGIVVGWQDPSHWPRA